MQITVYHAKRYTLPPMRGGVLISNRGVAVALLCLLVTASCSTKQPQAPTAQTGHENRAPLSDNVVSSGDDVARKKQAFFTQMKPHVVAENSRILEVRARLMVIRDDAGSIGSEERVWLSSVADTYKVRLPSRPGALFWAQILERVDIVPVELALVQAAIESAWGSSRFAREANNFFGQWCYSKGCGLVPNARKSGLSHEVRIFSSPQESVHVYMRNINRSRAYREFRRLRQEQHIYQRPLDATQLALGLRLYSERGMAYVKVIQSMIRSNRELIKQI